MFFCQVLVLAIILQTCALYSASASLFGGFSALRTVPKLRIGTRGSPLALAQAHQVKELVEAKFPRTKVEIKEIMTQGDSILNQALSEIGGKGLFVKELDTALLQREVDICVHSMKDVPTAIVPGTVLPCMLPREVTNDVFISRKYKTLADVPDYATIGSASLRRKAQLLQMNPTWNVVNFRGNVQTRLRKLDQGEVDGTMLALAGLRRLGMHDLVRQSQIVPASTMLPAVAQGAIGIQCRADDDATIDMLRQLDDPSTRAAAECERSFLAAMDGNCRTPIACQAHFLRRKQPAADGSTDSDSDSDSDSGSGSGSGGASGDRSGGRGAFSAFDRLLVSGMIARPDGRDMVRIAVEAPLPKGHAHADSEESITQHASAVGRSMGQLLRSDVIGEQRFQEYHDSFLTPPPAPKAKR